MKFYAKHFKFKNAWLREPMCQQIVKEIWQEHHKKSLQGKLMVCSKVLSKWGKEITSSFKNRTNHSKKIMQTLKGRRDQNSVQIFQRESK